MCFWGHKWGKWEDAKLGAYLRGKFIGDCPGQRRECVTCGLKEFK